VSDALSMPSVDASVAVQMNEPLCLGSLQGTALLGCVTITSTEESKMPSEANTVVSRNANCKKRFLF